ncbi:hypothetical protein [Paenibacillus periandrae]|uniref:hypothetical protein n=1 Tax=Paenibacillus periandrae TaxID=1761741 RepID=UPI001F08EE66|nr:hypothetical protein [Paenibacillus periandrae]
MSKYAYSELRKVSTEDERLRLVMEEINRIMETKKHRTFVQRIFNQKPKTQPKGWR